MYISYSGRKDSTVLSHIAKTMYPDILYIFANTTNEYPETLQHIKWEKEENKANIITVVFKDSNGEIWTFKKWWIDTGTLCFQSKLQMLSEHTNMP